MIVILAGALTLVSAACQGRTGSAEAADREGEDVQAGTVSGAQSPEHAFLRRIAEAAERNDAEALTAMLHPDVVTSFGRERCLAAFRQEAPPGLVVAGRPILSTMAAWDDADGRTQIHSGGRAFQAAVTLMDGSTVRGITSFTFVQDASGQFHLFADCSDRIFKTDL